MGFHFARKTTDAESDRLADELAAGGAVLVEFAQRDAPACRLEEAITAKVARRYDGRLRVLRSDVEESPGDAAAYSVTAVPTFVFFLEGLEKFRLVGYQSVDTLTRAIDEVLPKPA